MKEKVLGTLTSKASAQNLDYNDGVGTFYMNDDTPWLWAKAKNDIGKINTQSLSNTAKLLKGHQTRVDACLAQNWEKGTEFANRHDKWRAKVSVLNELEKSSDKKLVRAELILSTIISELAENEGLKEKHVMSEETKQQWKVAESIVTSASSFVRSVGCKMSSATTRVLTGLTAALAPQPHPITKEQLSKREFSTVLGLNRNSK